MRRFHETVTALCSTILAEQGRLHQMPPGEDTIDRVAGFVLEQHARMPDWLRPATVAAALAFDAWGLLRRGRWFRHQPLSARSAQLASWRRSRLAACRDFIRLFESLCVFAWWCELSGQESHAAR